MNDPYQISQDPIWHRWIDGLIILFIGIATGVVVAGTIMMTGVTTTTHTTEIIRRGPSLPQVESGARTDIPSGVKLEEV